MAVRRSAWAVVCLVLTGIALTATAQSAAAEVPSFVLPTGWAYIDSQGPDQVQLNPTGDAPVGKLGGDRYRSFFTFDISRYMGTDVSFARLVGGETEAQDCAHRQVELWTTAPVTAASSWRNPPAELQKVGTLGPLDTTLCPTPSLQWITTAAVQQAVAAGQTTLTLEMRLPEEQENDPSLGRKFATDPYLQVIYNTPPLKPTLLSFNDRACAAPPGPWDAITNDHVLTAQATDPDGNGFLQFEYAFWPVAAPDQVTTLTREIVGGLPERLFMGQGAFADATSYALHARVIDDEGASSPWSEPCYFQTDYTRPGTPTISSLDYTGDGSYGGQGIPGRFTFSGNGDPDVFAFQHYWNSGEGAGEAQADQPGGTATVALAPPSLAVDTLVVDSVDRAGNRSSTPATYRITAGYTQPLVQVPFSSHLGGQYNAVFSPAPGLPSGYDHVVAYRYSHNGGPVVEVPAGPDGGATVQLVVTEPNTDRLSVQSVSDNGWVSPAVEAHVFVEDSPSVTSTSYPEGGVGGGVGVPGTFTITPYLPGSTELLYSFDFGVTIQSAPVRPDGTATLTWTPDAAGPAELAVLSQTPDGTQSAPYFYEFTVAG